MPRRARGPCTVTGMGNAEQRATPHSRLAARNERTSRAASTERSVLLPSLALASLVVTEPFLPRLPHFVLTYLTPLSAWILLAWAGQQFLRPTTRAQGWWRFAMSLTLIWLLYKTVTSPDVVASLRWSVAATGGVLLAGLAGRSMGPRTLRLLVGTVLYSGMAVGLFSLVERLTEHNPFDPLLAAHLGNESIQHWSTYRAHAGFGHPLVNGAFLAFVAAFAVGNLLTPRARLKRIALVSAMTSTLGALSTGSRSAIAGILAAAAVLIVMLAVDSKRSLTVKVAFPSLSAATALWILQSPLLAERLDSSEAAASANYRSINRDFALNLASQYGGTGAGAGISQRVAEAAGSGTPIENSYLEILVSLGWPGVVLLVACILLPLGTAIRERRLAIAAGITAFLVASFGFALWETNPAILSLLGVLIAMAHAPHASWSAATKNVLDPDPGSDTAGRPLDHPLDGNRIRPCP